MTSESDDLEQALQQNLEIRRELGAEIGKVDGIRRSKPDRGIVYRLGWVLYWACLVIAGAWAAFLLWWASVEPGVIQDVRGSSYLAVLMMAPFALLYGLGRAFRYVLSAE